MENLTERIQERRKRGQVAQTTWLSFFWERERSNELVNREAWRQKKSPGHFGGPWEECGREGEPDDADRKVVFVVFLLLIICEKTHLFIPFISPKDSLA